MYDMFASGENPARINILKGISSNMKNTKKGFTLVELVIVIAVIAILAGVLIPTFSNVVANASRSADLQEITQKVEAAYLAYVTENSDAPKGIGRITDNNSEAVFDSTEDSKHYGFTNAATPDETYDAYVVVGKKGYAFEITMENGSYVVTDLDRKYDDNDVLTSAITASVDDIVVVAADPGTSTLEKKLAGYGVTASCPKKNMYFAGDEVTVTVTVKDTFPTEKVLKLKKGSTKFDLTLVAGTPGTYTYTYTYKVVASANNASVDFAVTVEDAA